MKKLFLMLSITGTVLLGTAQDKSAPVKAAPAPAKAAAPVQAVTPPAQDPVAAPDPNAPEFKWDNTTIDYGTVVKADENNAKREFKFTNTGKSPLIISGCKGSCGCTVPTCPTEPILPGGKGSISVHYDINRVGPFTKTVTVTSNAKNPNETLKITGTVNDPDAGKTPAPVNPTPSPVAPTNPH